MKRILREMLGGLHEAEDPCRTLLPARGQDETTGGAHLERMRQRVLQLLYLASVQADNMGHQAGVIAKHKTTSQPRKWMSYATYAVKLGNEIERLRNKVVGPKSI